MNNSQTIAETIEYLSKNKGISISALLSELKINKNALFTMKNSGNLPRLENVVKIADYFDVPVDFLLGRKSVPKSKKDMAIEIGADISYAKESLAELEQLVDRITEKVNRLKISLSEVTQTAVEEPTE